MQNVSIFIFVKCDFVTIKYFSDPIPEFPLDFGQVFNEASDVFQKIVGKMVAKKKFLGINSEWPWS